TSSNDQPFLVFLSVERLKNPARGRMGGSAGAAGRIRVEGHDEDLPGKGELRIEPGDRLIFETPGGGGFGPARERDPDRVARDVKRGLVSKTAANRDYGRST
ncbi:MAG: hydantoinase B/oxoprolinase family protein, partial [Pseudomonadota bacterium]